MAGGVVTEGDIIDALRERYASPAFGFLDHVPTGTGGHAERTIDGVAMSLWPSRGYHLIGFEIKVSRSDWLRELKMPAKADAAFKCVDQWHVVAPAGVVKPGEVPKGWGYFTFDPDLKRTLRQIIPATDQTPAPAITRHFLAALFRKIVANGITAARLQDEINQAVERGKAAGRNDAPGYERLRVMHDGILAKVHAFEESSGVTILGGYQDVGRIAEAVRALTAQYESTRSRLTHELTCLNMAAEGVGRALSELDRYHEPTATDRGDPKRAHDADCSADTGI